MCDLCSEYGVQTVSISKHGKQVEVCFRCVEEEASRKFLPEGDDLVRQAEEDEVNGNKTARA